MLPARARPMHSSRRSISWTSFSSPWVKARDSNREVDLAVGRLMVPAHTGRGYRVPRYVVSSVPTWARGRHLTRGFSCGGPADFIGRRRLQADVMLHHAKPLASRAWSL